MILWAFYFAVFPNQEIALSRDLYLFITPIDEFNLKNLLAHHE